MNFLLNYTLENEIKNVEKIVNMLQWFENNSYKILLPVGIKCDSNKDTIATAVEKEFETNQNIFNSLKPALDYLIEQNQVTINTFFSSFNYNVPENITVNFTSYGPGGMYLLPDTAVVMLKDSPQWVLQMIIHETIHLVIEEPFVNKYNLSHWKKELAVDTLCLSEQLNNIFIDYKHQKQTEGIKSDFLSRLDYKKTLGG